ncbi:MAG: hypothetical protein ABIH27_02685 [Candidatus Omnitrophota bacterium]
MIEGMIKGSLKFWQGYTDNYLKVRIESNKDIHNCILAVKLKDIERDYFIGQRK